MGEREEAAAMGNNMPSGMGDDKAKKEEKKKKRHEAPQLTRVGKKKKPKGPMKEAKTPTIYPSVKCRLRLLKLERVKDYLLMEEEFVKNQERLKKASGEDSAKEELNKVDELRGTPMGVSTLEEMIDDTHAIVSSSVGPEYYVSIMSFVDKDQIEPGCTVLTHNKTLAIVGLLGDDVDPMVNVMKVDKAPTETFAVWSRRFRRLRRQWSCHLHTLSCTRTLVSS